MKLKGAAIRSGIIIGIVVLSIVFGLIFQSVSDKLDRKKYPREFGEFVSKYSEQYGVPQNVILAVIKTESNFDSSLLSEDGKIGLMQVSPEVLEKYKDELRDPYDTGMLYDPETNIKYGTYKLSKLYMKLGTWKAVFAALGAGEETVGEWLADERYSVTEEFSKPRLETIPDPAVAEYAEKLSDTSEKYKELYYNN